MQPGRRCKLLRRHIEPGAPYDILRRRIFRWVEEGYKASVERAKQQATEAADTAAAAVFQWRAAGLPLVIAAVAAWI
ncbi:hypothetical protein CN148_05795 [Sinorhizobium meliloti]|nr:hypothetical protein CN148_05795 [Sinorhizobium meliloti]